MQKIKELVHQGCILGVNEQAADYPIRPASLDLTMSDEVYRLEEIFLPRKNETIRTILKNIRHLRHDPYQPLERNVLYLARMNESLKLPANIYAFCNPKSSSGRVDIQVRVLADGISRYDAIMSGGFTGELWLLIGPKSFPVVIPPGETLSQIRFFNADCRLSDKAVEEELATYPLLRDPDGQPISSSNRHLSDRDGALLLGIDVTHDFVGWECLGLNRILDLSKRKHYIPSDFFQPLHSANGAVRLRSGAFYILYTRERVQVPPHLACEMIPMDERSGEFRAHYAGFIDPGWGWGAKGEAAGRRLVLEVRPFEDLILRDAQPVAKIRFEKMSEIPTELYDLLGDSNYSNDMHEASTPKLSKHFSMA